MIGERDALGKGLGAADIRLVAEAALSDPAVPFVIAATAVENTASLRAFAKAGFHEELEFDDVPHGRCVLLVKRRPVGCIRRGGHAVGGSGLFWQTNI